MVALDIFHLIFRGVKPTELMIPSEKVGLIGRRDETDQPG